MKEHKSYMLFTAIIAAIVMVGVMFTMLPVAAAPPAAPTPVAAPDSTGIGKYINIQPATALAADTNSRNIDILEFETLDFQYVIDQGTVNTTTLTVQYSIDGTNFTDGAALVSANAADANAVVVRVPAYGRYARINQNLTNANTITITLLAVGR